MLTGPILAQFNQRDAHVTPRIFGDTARHWADARWLSESNRYARNCIEQLDRDFAPNKRIRHSHLREYIAASVIIHCLDGWSYLSRALNALLVGDHDCARHLGYYAELRAAMSILAAAGVGVFNQKHAVITAESKCVKAQGPGTHKFVWEALQNWGQSADAQGALFSSIRGGGQPLAEWLRHFAATPSLTGTLASAWLHAWGLDIGRLAHDREARNLSSYRPTVFSSSRPVVVGTTVGFVSRLWRACEPSTDSSFAPLDREIIRATLRENFKSTHGRSHKQARAKFTLRVDSVLKFMQPTSQPGLDWRQFILEPAADPQSLLSIASGSDGPDSPKHAMQVAARALLLLRVSTGRCHQFIQSVPLTEKSHLLNLLTLIGEDRALWARGQMPSPINDLWKDPFDALGELQKAIGAINSYADLWRLQPLSASVLTSLERAGFWGMCA